MEKIKLTQSVQKGGCAAKVAASELRKILAQVRFPPRDENLLVDGDLFDDAAIYKVPRHLEPFPNQELALVQTLDFFTPIVDTPYVFGQVAAANSLSDVYAMGGLPKTAMAILAFPLASLPGELIAEVLQGASDKIKEAQCQFVGGHSIDDDTLKFGLSVTGFVPLSSVWSNATAQTGDHLILCKALGTGCAMAALKQGQFQESDLTEILESMTQLNNLILDLSAAQRLWIHAATDITGFGLLGHAQQMAQASRKQIHFGFQLVPFFEASKWALQNGFLTKAHRTNAEYTVGTTRLAIEVQSSSLVKLLYDPQTSGGLLLSVDPLYSADLLRTIQKKFPRSAIIGQVKESQDKFSVVVENSVEL